jgi:hypothetical protein
MIKTLRDLAAAALLSCLAGGAAAAQSAPAITILELFTSQGCSSCPAADALFKSYVERPDVLALSYSVDYWDYLGWKDTLANPKFTERQRGYGKAVSNGQIYTPQMVVNGARHVVGSSRGDIDAAVTASRGSAAAQAFKVDASRADGNITVQSAGGAAASPLAGPAAGIVWLVTVRGQQTIAVKRGENGGRSLTYFNSVRDVTQVGEWTGKPATFRLPVGTMLGADERYAVLIQRHAQGPLLAAGWVK